MDIMWDPMELDEDIGTGADSNVVSSRLPAVAEMPQRAQAGLLVNAYVTALIYFRGHLGELLCHYPLFTYPAVPLSRFSLTLQCHFSLMLFCRILFRVHLPCCANFFFRAFLPCAP